MEYNGLRAVVLENDLLRVVVLADHGAKIHEFVYKPAIGTFSTTTADHSISSGIWLQCRQLVDGRPG